MKYIVDADDFCRSCKGTGDVKEYIHHSGITRYDTCWYCNGSGLRSLIILPNKEEQ